MIPKNNLVIVRAGANSLHRNWLNQDYSERNFDVVISYFNQQAFDSHAQEPGVTTHFYKGGKWDGIYNTIENLPELLDKYDYIWLPDDDIDCDGQTVTKLFELMQNHDIKVGQPSLTHDSYFTHFLFMCCPRFQLRFTNYIEVMVPCLHRETLKAILPEFRRSMSGFGMDYIWCRLNGVGHSKAAIFDGIKVHHTRPVGNVLISAMSKDGKHPKDEEKALCDRYGIAMGATPIAYAGLLRDGQVIAGTRSMAWEMVKGYLSKIQAFSESRKRNYGFGRLIQLVRRQYTRPYDLTEIRRQDPA